MRSERNGKASAPGRETPAQINRRTVDRYIATSGADRRNRHRFFTGDGVCVSLYSSAGVSKAFRGKHALARLGAWIDDQFPDWKWTNIEISTSPDGATFIVECDGVGSTAPDGPAHRSAVHYVHIFELRDGLIVEVREFSDMRQKYALTSTPFPRLANCPFLPI